MILLTNSATQTVAPGEAVAFDTVIFQTGAGECHRRGSGAVSMRSDGIYDIEFSANLGSVAAGTAELAITVGGEPLNETVMDTVTAAAGNLENVATMTAVRNCCGGYDRIAVENTGATSATVDNVKLFVKRIA